MNYYIQVPSTFITAMAGKESTINVNSFFGYRTTTDGRFMCSSNSVNDFPVEFGTLGTITLVPLNVSDFPVTPTIV